MPKKDDNNKHGLVPVIPEIEIATPEGQKANEDQANEDQMQAAFDGAEVLAAFMRDGLARKGIVTPDGPMLTLSAEARLNLANQAIRVMIKYLDSLGFVAMTMPGSYVANESDFRLMDTSDLGHDESFREAAVAFCEGMKAAFEFAAVHGIPCGEVWTAYSTGDGLLLDVLCDAKKGESMGDPMDMDWGD